MRVLVACEFSGIVRDAFASLGHDSWSCDLLPTERPGQHIQGDVLRILEQGWDLVIAHPPCTHLSVSGARWFSSKRQVQADAIHFFLAFARCSASMVAIENPVSIMSTFFRLPDQVIQPWQFGHGEVKATCLWLRGLPRLRPTAVVFGRHARVHRMSPGPNRSRERSRTYPGIASAMAAQWSEYIARFPTLF